jgi:hypothetical protein
MSARMPGVKHEGDLLVKRSLLEAGLSNEFEQREKAIAELRTAFMNGDQANKKLLEEFKKVHEETVQALQVALSAAIALHEQRCHPIRMWWRRVVAWAKTPGPMPYLD